MKQPTQQERILAILGQVRDGDHEIPQEYIRRHPSGDGLSSRYLKRVLWITECNGRISELRSQGYVIETSTEKDAYGFAYHRLVSEPTARQLAITVSAIENSLARHHVPGSK
jgi:hypothetical protein